MPNGFHGSIQDWVQMEKPLRDLDEILNGFAKQHDMTVTSNYHSWPERSLEWGEAMRRLLCIFLSDEKAMLFEFSLMAGEDRGHQRYWRKETLERAIPADRLEEEVPQLLERGYERLLSWSEEDLVYAGEISEP